MCISTFRNINATMTMIKSFVGVGTLSLPFAFAQSGYLVSHLQ